MKTPMKTPKGKKAVETPVEVAIETPVEVAIETPVEVAIETPVEVEIGDYKLTIAGDKETAIAKLTNNKGAVILDKVFYPEVLAEICGIQPKLDAIEAAKYGAIAAYHNAVKFTDGLIDIEAVLPHPYNREIYGNNEPIDDLIQHLEKPGAEIHPIVINEKGWILSGNRRIDTAQYLNNLHKDKPPYLVVMARVETYSSLESELRAIVLNNATRDKSKKQKLNEIKILEASVGVSMKDSRIGLPTDRRIQLRQDIGKVLGMGETSTYHFSNAIAIFDSFADKVSEKLIQSLKEFTTDSPKKGLAIANSKVSELPAMIRDIVSQEDWWQNILSGAIAAPRKPIDQIQQELIASLINPPAPVQIPTELDLSEGFSFSPNFAGTAPTSDTVSTLTLTPIPTSDTVPTLTPTPVPTSDTVPTLTPTPVPTPDPTISDLIQTMKLLGDLPSDNRLTPKEIVEIALESMRYIDVDCFASPVDSNIPASIEISIIENAFKSDRIAGNCFANPPFSKASEAIALLDKKICDGRISKLFLILPSSTQSTKAFHSFLVNHNPGIYLPKKRLEFDPGVYLLASEEKPGTNSNRDASVILFYSVDTSDYDKFQNAIAGSGWFGRKFTPYNPYPTFNQIAHAQWNETQEKVTLDFFEAKIEISNKDGLFKISIGDEHYATTDNLDTAKKIALIGAIENLAI